jgi:hypothetical protein
VPGPVLRGNLAGALQTRQIRRFRRRFAAAAPAWAALAWDAPVPPATPLPGRLRKFLEKSRHDRVRAVAANLYRALHWAGLRRTPGPRPDFPRLLAADVASIGERLGMLLVIEGQRDVRAILADPRFDDPRRLLRAGRKVYSQNDEDGIIEEIFARIGHGSRIFVEFGVGDGLENNTLKLLLEGWSGLWLDGDPGHVAQIRGKFADVIAQGRLQARQAFLDRDNINRVIGQSHAGEIDLLSIDVDGNDIHLLEALDVVRPRAIAIEYNGKFLPPLNIAQAYDPAFRWTGTDYSGASLVAVAKIAERRGYALVGCNVTGLNAFFVRHDLLGDKFCPPYTAEHHFMPARYFLTPSFVVGHPPDWGRYVPV